MQSKNAFGLGSELHSITSSLRTTSALEGVRMRSELIFLVDADRYVVGNVPMGKFAVQEKLPGFV